MKPVCTAPQPSSTEESRHTVKLWLTGVALVVASVPITAIAVASHSRPLLVVVLAALGGCLLCAAWQR